MVYNYYWRCITTIFEWWNKVGVLELGVRRLDLIALNVLFIALAFELPEHKNILSLVQLLFVKY